jgi:hypothetical protein
MTHKGGKKRLDKLQARRQDFNEMMKNMRDEDKKGFTCPGSNKK